MALVACSTGKVAAPDSNAAPLVAPTYYGAVQAIVTEHCAKCHFAGGVGPFPLTTYEETRGKANLMSAEVIARRMPPWGAQDSSECAPPLPWRSDERLTDDEISAIREWAATGAPAGDAAAAKTVALDAPQATFDLASPTYVLSPKKPYLPSTVDDDFRCFVLDLPPELDAGGFISAIDVVPGDRRIVHHATVWADRDGIASASAGPDGSYDCSSSTPAPVAADGSPPDLWWLLSWAPGARPLDLPDNVGIEIPAHSKIVMQVHYSVGGRDIVPESTQLQLLMRSDKPAYAITAWGVGNASEPLPNGDGLLPQDDDADGFVEFRIPARETNHVEGMQSTWPFDAERRLFGVRAHAHLAATDIKVDLLHDEADQCLLQDRWDFHWQRVYTYDAAVDELPLLTPGDRIRLRCTYDNTLANPRLGEELYERNLPVTDIYLGDSTLDEMCTADILYIRALD